MSIGHGKRDPVAVLAVLLEVEWRPGVADVGARAFDHVEQPVEADRGAPEGRKVKSVSHFQILLLKQFGREKRRKRAGALVSQPGPVGARRRLARKPIYDVQEGVALPCG
jgi:hypothetical protein